MLPAKPDVVVLCWSTPSESDRRAHAIASFMGADTAFASLYESAPADRAVRGPASVPRGTCLIVGAETLAKAVDAMPTGIEGLESVTSDVAGHVVVYGFEPTDRHTAVLRALSSGSLQGIQQLPDTVAPFHVANGYQSWCGPFSGVAAGTIDPARDYGFVETGSPSESDAMIHAANAAFLVRAEHRGAQMFFIGCAELADLDEGVGRQTHVLGWFSRLVPLMMVLRGALGSRLWHNDAPRACFIIDDPLIQKRYGFLDYRRLVESTRQHKFFPCIAFIPWNYKRSSAKVTGLLSSTYDAPYLCVHGCDHTRAEFAPMDFESLRGKAHLALERMRAQSTLSGVPFDDVMVFPQGLFSVEAVAALKASGYLAAVNTDVCPSSTPSRALALRDLLEVAVTRFADFPLFGRRYPRDIAEFAWDLFMGKPALVVEHHGYFRDGYAALESFVGRLNGLERRLEWTGLGSICARACLTRTVAGGDVHVRFYTSRFSLTNPGPETQRYVLGCRRMLDGPLAVVTINGHEWECETTEGLLTIRVCLSPGQTADIRVASDRLEAAGLPWAGTPHHKAKVRLRRYLSEFRDNHVDTSRALTAVVAAARTVRRDVKLHAAQSLDARSQ